MSKKYYLTHFCNHEIPRLGCHQTPNLGLAKTARIAEFRILGLQSLTMTILNLTVIDSKYDSITASCKFQLSQPPNTSVTK